MKFVKTSEMEMGRTIAKPIYNRQGLLLYNAGAKVDDTMIKNFRNADLYGTYVLDHGEPLPIITEEELEFDRFQSMNYYVVDDILNAVVKGKPIKGLEELTDQIFRRYGFLKKKVIFNQSLRSEKDFVSKHSLNVAILCAMISDKMKFDNKEKLYLIQAAIYHDVGKLLVPPAILHKQGKLSSAEMQQTHQCILDGYDLLGKNFSFAAGVRRYLLQLSRDMTNGMPGYPAVEQTLLPGTKILKVADIYDTLTAIRPYKNPMSVVKAFLIMHEESDKYEPRVVEALEECLNILPVGSYVNLSNGEQAIVIAENARSIFHPRVLSLDSNKIYDLSDRELRKEIQITDSVFTQDNRQKIVADKVKGLVEKAKAEM